MADDILALIQESLPDLAKEAGYVKLAKDQSLPPNPVRSWEDLNPQHTYSKAQKDMLKAGFRKVELEK